MVDVSRMLFDCYFEEKKRASKRTLLDENNEKLLSYKHCCYTRYLH